jgi:hypothetical protein
MPGLTVFKKYTAFEGVVDFHRAYYYIQYIKFMVRQEVKIKNQKYGRKINMAAFILIATRAAIRKN